MNVLPVNHGRGFPADWGSLVCILSNSSLVWLLLSAIKAALIRNARGVLWDRSVHEWKNMTRLQGTITQCQPLLLCLLYNQSLRARPHTADSEPPNRWIHDTTPPYGTVNHIYRNKLTNTRCQHLASLQPCACTSLTKVILEHPCVILEGKFMTYLAGLM